MFYTFHYYILKSTDVLKMWFIKLTAKMNGCSFQQVFCLSTRKPFFLEVSFWSQQEEHRFFYKTVVGIFKIALCLIDWHVFFVLWQSVVIFNVLNTLTLKEIFWKMQTFFKKLKYRFSVESTGIENTSFPYKTAISETNVIKQIEW